MTAVPTPIPSRTQFVLEGIKHRILTGQLTPGQALVETELAAQAPLALAAAKRTMRLGLDTGFEANAHHVMAELLALFRSKDFSESVTAFLEKRDPVYQGR